MTKQPWKDPRPQVLVKNAGNRTQGLQMVDGVGCVRIKGVWHEYLASSQEFGTRTFLDKAEREAKRIAEAEAKLAAERAADRAEINALKLMVAELTKIVAAKA